MVANTYFSSPTSLKTTMHRLRSSRCCGSPWRPPSIAGQHIDQHTKPQWKIRDYWRNSLSIAVFVACFSATGMRHQWQHTAGWISPLGLLVRPSQDKRMKWLIFKAGDDRTKRSLPSRWTSKWGQPSTGGIHEKMMATRSFICRLL